MANASVWIERTKQLNYCVWINRMHNHFKRCLIINCFTNVPINFRSICPLFKIGANITNMVVCLYKIKIDRLCLCFYCLFWAKDIWRQNFAFLRNLFFIFFINKTELLIFLIFNIFKSNSFRGASFMNYYFSTYE